MTVTTHYSVIIRRYIPGGTAPYREDAFSVPGNGRTTVLQALQYIYAHCDPALAFDYSCRYARCGLCAVAVNGRPRLACTTFLEGKTTVAPLPNLPPLRDLVINRDPLEQLLREEGIFFRGRPPAPAGTMAPQRHGKTVFPPGPAPNIIAPGPPSGSCFPNVPYQPALEKLMGCLECLCCHARCPQVAAAGGDLKRFAGPFVFLKLAQLHLDPRDRFDRKTQARRLGIEQCLHCRGCRCPSGLPLYREAIRPLLED